jgi:hypothetical protein
VEVRESACQGPDWRSSPSIQNVFTEMHLEKFVCCMVDVGSTYAQTNSLKPIAAVRSVVGRSGVIPITRTQTSPQPGPGFFATHLALVHHFKGDALN